MLASWMRAAAPKTGEPGPGRQAALWFLPIAPLVIAPRNAMPRRESETQMIDPQSALVYTMVLVSAADREMTDAELTTIGESVKHLPVFHGYDTAKLVSTASRCAEMLNEEEGFEKVMNAVKEHLPSKLAETAYALACDVAAADGAVSSEEMELLAVIRQRLSVGRLPAAAIERGARARHMTI